MIVSHSRKFIFVHVQKTGGSSVAIGLDPFLAWDDIVLGGSPRGQAIEGPFQARFGLRKHSPVSEIEKICGRELTENYFTFATVRHPLGRMCSFYNFVVSAVNRWSAANGVELADIPAYLERHPDAVKPAPFLGWQATKAFFAAPDFSGFIRNEYLARGYLSQTDHLKSGADGRVHCRAFKLEEHAIWVPELARLLDVPFELPHRNRTREILTTPESVSAEDRHHIEERYSADYATFGY